MVIFGKQSFTCLLLLWCYFDSQHHLDKIRVNDNRYQTADKGFVPSNLAHKKPRCTQCACVSSAAHFFTSVFLLGKAHSGKALTRRSALPSTPPQDRFSARDFHIATGDREFFLNFQGRKSFLWNLEDILRETQVRSCINYFILFILKCNY